MSPHLVGTVVTSLVQKMTKTDKEVAPSLRLWVSGFLILAVVIAAIIGGLVYFYSPK
jgi:hypothetical protein